MPGRAIPKMHRKVHHAGGNTTRQERERCARRCTGSTWGRRDIWGDGAPEDFLEIFETAMQTAPTKFKVSRPIPLNARLEVRA